MQPEQSTQLLARLLVAASQARASDVHLRVGQPPFFRIDGGLSRTNAPPLTEADIQALVKTSSGRTASEGGTTDWEYSFEEQQGTRFRGHVFRENGRWAVTIRVVPRTIPTFQELRLPPSVKHLADAGAGLVLITGPTGSGKTTSAASVLRYIAQERACHIVTIEDPVEYRIAEPNSCVSQREVGRDTMGFTDGLRAALREDPDVLFIGEIRDRETLDVAMQAAETGHQVVSTFHTGTSVQTVLRLISMFAQDEQAAVRERLADSLKGIICQRLLRRRKTKGRVLATEICINNYSVKECIRDPGRMKTLPALLERSKDQSMYSLDQDLTVLVREGLVEADVALAHASSPGDVRRALNLGGMVA